MGCADVTSATRGDGEPQEDRDASVGEREHSVDGRVDDFVTAVLTASRVLVGISARSLDEVETAVTVAQFRTLVVLHSRGETNLNGLAERLGVNASTAMRMIDKLLAAELVTREDNPQDRREVLLKLTAAGVDLVESVTDRRRAEIAKIVKAMPSARRGELISALNAFAEAAGEPTAEAARGHAGW